MPLQLWDVWITWSARGGQRYFALPARPFDADPPEKADGHLDQVMAASKRQAIKYATRDAKLRR